MQPICPIHTALIPSTNTALKRLAADGAPEGTLLIADAQSGGYGRLARAFFSPPNTGLYMSLLLRPTWEATYAAFLTPLAAVATAMAVEELTGHTIEIKWVNDLYLGEKKAAGILVEGAPAPDGVHMAYAVIGIGVNLFPPESGFPPHIANTATAVFPSDHRPRFKQLRDAMAHRITSHIARLYDAMPSIAFLEEYRRRSLLIGKEVLVFDPLVDREKQGVGTPARVLGITDDFGLMVSYEDQTQAVLRGGEVTLRVR